MAADLAVTLLDAVNLKCPLPVLKARKALAGLAPGAVLEVLATIPAQPRTSGLLSGHRPPADRAQRQFRRAEISHPERGLRLRNVLRATVAAGRSKMAGLDTTGSTA